MLSVIVIAVGVLIVIGLILVSAEHHARKVKIAVVLVILMMIYFSVVAVLSSGNVNLSSPGGIVSGVYYYFGWLGSSIAQVWDIGKDSAIAVGNVIKMNNSEKHDDGRN